ncbi:MAG: hypothetical protein P8R00_03670, partial [Candidatus Poseidoniaceae archaeon]|nr:hypothetical protein [Candidatus Poseidoniaceae archaeon]
PRSLILRQKAITFMSGSIQRGLVATMRKGLILCLVFGLFMAPCLVPSASAQGSPIPAVELDCGPSNPVLDVRPTSDAEMNFQCTVTNPSSASETISIETLEWDGTLVELALSEDSFTLAAGEEDTFDIVFTGQTKIPASTDYSFEIGAKVESWNNIPIGQLPEGTLVFNTTYSGDLIIESYGMVELLLSDVSTRYMDTSEEVEFSFQVTNKGNDDDLLEVVFVNAGDLEAAQFTFPSGKLVNENVAYQGTSSVKTLSIRAPSSVSEDIRMPLIIRAQSGDDDNAPFSEVTIQLDITAPSKNAGIDGLDSLNSDSTLLYASVGGGAILLVLFLVVLIRVVTKKKPSKGKLPQIQQPIILPDEPVQQPSTGDFDDLFDDLDESTSSNDEFDDLFDDL